MYYSLLLIIISMHYFSTAIELLNPSDLELECRLTGVNCESNILFRNKKIEIIGLVNKLQSQPNIHYHYTALIQAYMNNGQLNKAGEVLNQFEEMQRATIRNAGTATSLQWIDRAQLMISILKKSVSINVGIKNHPFGDSFTDLVLYNVGLQALRVQNYPKALKYLQLVAKNIPYWPPGQYALGLSFYYTGQLQLAAKMFQAVNQSIYPLGKSLPILAKSSIRNFNLILASAEAHHFANEKYRIPLFVDPSPSNGNPRKGMIELAVKEALRSSSDHDGILIELGVWKGDSLRIIAATASTESPISKTVVGFDSFYGLPEDFAGGQFRRSAFSTKGRIPSKLPINVDIYKGWFNQTVPNFFKNRNTPVLFVHIDCDLYSSSFEALNVIAQQLIAGSVLQFDQYFGYPEWKLGEAKAWRDVSNKYGIQYSFVRYHETKMTIKIESIQNCSNCNFLK